jgi:transposase
LGFKLTQEPISDKEHNFAIDETCLPTSIKQNWENYKVNLENEKKREKGFGKLNIFTDKNEWLSKKIVQTYNNKYLVDDDFKLLNDELLMPLAQYIIQRISISGFMFSLQLWVCFFIGIWHGRRKSIIFL